MSKQHETGESKIKIKQIFVSVFWPRLKSRLAHLGAPAGSASVRPFKLLTFVNSLLTVNIS